MSSNAAHASLYVPRAARSSSRPGGEAVAEMIDTYYGHLARDSEDSIRARLDARSAQRGVDLASDGD